MTGCMYILMFWHYFLHKNSHGHTAISFQKKRENSMLLRNVTLLWFWYYKIPRFPLRIQFVYLLLKVFCSFWYCLWPRACFTRYVGVFEIQIRKAKIYCVTFWEQLAEPEDGKARAPLGVLAAKGKVLHSWLHMSGDTVPDGDKDFYMTGNLT